MPEFPSMAAWLHREARAGFEVLFIRRDGDCFRCEGYSTAIQERESWGIRYGLTVDGRWVTRSAHVFGQSSIGVHEVRLEGDGSGAGESTAGPRRSWTGAWTSISRRRPARTPSRSTGWDCG